MVDRFKAVVNLTHTCLVVEGHSIAERDTLVVINSKVTVVDKGWVEV